MGCGLACSPVLSPPSGSPHLLTAALVPDPCSSLMMQPGLGRALCPTRLPGAVVSLLATEVPVGCWTEGHRRSRGALVSGRGWVPVALPGGLYQDPASQAGAPGHSAPLAAGVALAWPRGLSMSQRVSWRRGSSTTWVGWDFGASLIGMGGCGREQDVFRSQMHRIESVTVFGPSSACLIYHVVTSTVSWHRPTTSVESWDPASVPGPPELAPSPSPCPLCGVWQGRAPHGCACPESPFARHLFLTDMLHFSCSFVNTFQAVGSHLVLLPLKHCAAFSVLLLVAGFISVAV